MRKAQKRSASAPKMLVTFCFACGMFQVHENEISLRKRPGGTAQMRTLRGGTLPLTLIGAKTVEYSDYRASKLLNRADPIDASAENLAKRT